MTQIKPTAPKLFSFCATGLAEGRALLLQRLAQRNIVVKRFDEIPMADIEVRWAAVAMHMHVACTCKRGAWLLVCQHLGG